MRLLFVAVGTILCAGAVCAQTPVPMEPVQVEIQVQFIAVPKPDADALLRAEASGILLKDRILDLEKQGTANVLCAPRIVTLSGQEANVRAVEECVYPTSLTVQPPQTNATSADAPQSVVVSPADLETREVGVILTCLPEVSRDGNIHLVLTPQRVTKPTWKIYKAKCIAANGEEREIDLEQPFFCTQTLSTSLLLKDGETVIAAGGMPDRNGETVTFLLVTARLVDTSGNPRTKKETVAPATEGAGTKRAAP